VERGADYRLLKPVVGWVSLGRVKELVSVGTRFCICDVLCSGAIFHGKCFEVERDWTVVNQGARRLARNYGTCRLEKIGAVVNHPFRFLN